MVENDFENDRKTYQTEQTCNQGKPNKNTQAANKQQQQRQRQRQRQQQQQPKNNYGSHRCWQNLYTEVNRTFPQACTRFLPCLGVSGFRVEHTPETYSDKQLQNHLHTY